MGISGAAAAGDAEELAGISHALDSAKQFWMSLAAEEDMPEVCEAAALGSTGGGCLNDSDADFLEARPLLSLAGGDGDFFFAILFSSGLGFLFRPVVAVVEGAAVVVTDAAAVGVLAGAAMLDTSPPTDPALPLVFCTSGVVPAGEAE